MYLGRIVELGPAEDVLDRPAAPVHQGTAVGRPEKPTTWSQQILVGEIARPEPDPAGCRFHPRCPVVASGAAATLGVASRCTSVDVALVARGDAHWSACHALDHELRGTDAVHERSAITSSPSDT